MSEPSTSSAVAIPAARPQADPLPSKRGELGYQPPKSPQMRQMAVPAVSDELVLPARHPADRDHQEAVARSAPNEPPNMSAVPAAHPGSNPDKKGWIQRFSYRGVSPITLLRIVLLFLFIAGTGAAWALTVIRVSEDANKHDDAVQDGDDVPDDGKIRLPPSFSSLVFVHVSFTIVALFELLFLERAFFHARAERYLFNHGVPRRGSSMASMGLAPWSRPPLPTYAAALAESGVGTGDVEDNLIAIPPPPAYGHTRGSVLLLAGLLPSNLVRTLSRSSETSEEGRSLPARRTSPESQMEEGRGRPLSYDASEEVDNAKRALELEMTLAHLENDQEKLEQSRRP